GATGRGQAPELELQVLLGGRLARSQAEARLRRRQARLRAAREGAGEGSRDLREGCRRPGDRAVPPRRQRLRHRGDAGGARARRRAAREAGPHGRPEGLAVSSGEEVFTPKPRRLGPRALVAVGAVLCLVVGGIIVSVFKGGGAKPGAPVARENPERPSEPRFLEQQPEAAGRFTAAVEARRREEERRREELRALLAAKTPAMPPTSPISQTPPAGSPLALSGAERGEAEDLAAVPSAEGAPPPGVYRPYPARSGRPFAAVPPAET